MFRLYIEIPKVRYILKKRYTQNKLTQHALVIHRIKPFQKVLIRMMKYYYLNERYKNRNYLSMISNDQTANNQNSKGYKVITKQFQPYVSYSAQIWFIHILDIPNDVHKAIEIISTYVISENELEQYNIFFDWQKKEIYKNRNVGILYLNAISGGLISSKEKNEIIHIQGCILNAINTANNGGSYHSVASMLKKIKTNITHKKEYLVDSIFVIIMISGLIKRIARKKLLKTMDVQEHSVLKQYMTPYGISDKSDCTKVLKWFKSYIGCQDSICSQNIMYLYFSRKKTLVDYIFYKQNVYYLSWDKNYNTTICVQQPNGEIIMVEDTANAWKFN